MFENKMRFKFVLFCLNIKTIIMISFSFLTIYSSSPLTHATPRVYVAENVVIIDFDDVLRLFVHSFQSHFHSNYRQYFNWAEFRSITLGFNFVTLLSPWSFVSFLLRLFNCIQASHLIRDVTSEQMLQIFSRRKKKNDLKGRMKIYEVYLLLFRKCFHIRYPHIKSSLQLNVSGISKHEKRFCDQERWKKHLTNAILLSWKVWMKVVRIKSVGWSSANAFVFYWFNLMTHWPSKLS